MSDFQAQLKKHWSLYTSILFFMLFLVVYLPAQIYSYIIYNKWQKTDTPAQDFGPPGFFDMVVDWMFLSGPAAIICAVFACIAFRKSKPLPTIILSLLLVAFIVTWCFEGLSTTPTN